MKERLRVLKWFARLFGSSTGFWALVVFFVLQASWIALSSHYPMAFDEDYHLGIIRLYAHHISPFWQTQPEGASAYGAVYRDPSYLYHYLFSFPYRLISAFTHDQTIQVLWLRMINIALFTSSLFIFRRLLRLLSLSELAANLSLLLFSLVPVASLLAAQINYDNLFIPLTALSMLWTVRLVQETLAYKRVNTFALLRLLLLCLLTSLVKYAFLPFFVAIIIGLIIVFVSVFRRRLKRFVLSLAFGFTLMSRLKRWTMVVLVIVSAGLFLQRYGVNFVRYHTPAPDCGQVLSIKECTAYGPWNRDYILAAQKVPGHYTPWSYLHQWFYGMWLRLFFTLDGPLTQYQTRAPLILPGVGAIVFALACLIVVLRYAKRLGHEHRITLGLPLLMTLLYIFSLWLDGYEAYKHTGQPVAINGRYLLPVLPVLFTLAILAWRYALTKRHYFKVVLATVATLCLLWGGGALTFILRSSTNWYWPNTAVGRVNADVRQTIGPIVPGYSNPTLFLH